LKIKQNDKISDVSEETIEIEIRPEKNNNPSQKMSFEYLANIPRGVPKTTTSIDNMALFRSSLKSFRVSHRMDVIWRCRIGCSDINKKQITESVSKSRDGFSKPN